MATASDDGGADGRVAVLGGSMKKKKRRKGKSSGDKKVNSKRIHKGSRIAEGHA